LHAGALLERKQVADDDKGQRQQPARAQPLHSAKGDQLLDALGLAAQQ
jgi:hypothetical protein